MRFGFRGVFLPPFVRKIGDPLNKESFTTRGSIIFPPKVAKGPACLGWGKPFSNKSLGGFEWTSILTRREGVRVPSHMAAAGGPVWGALPAKSSERIRRIRGPRSFWVWVSWVQGIRAIIRFTFALKETGSIWGLFGVGLLCSFPSGAASFSAFDILPTRRIIGEAVRGNLHFRLFWQEKKPQGYFPWRSKKFELCNSFWLLFEGPFEN